MKRLAMLFIVVLPAIFFLMVEGGALAHIQPVFAVPAEGQEFIVPPERVRIFFGEPVEGKYLRVYDERGGRVDVGDATVSGPIEDPTIDIDHKAVYSVGLKDLLAETYKVKYRHVARHRKRAEEYSVPPLRGEEVPEVLDHSGGGVLLDEVGATGYRPELRAGYGFV